MKLKIIKMQKVMIVLKLCMLLTLQTSCISQNVRSFNGEKELYEIVESRTYNSSALYYKTISSADISTLRFDYESLNTYNFNKSWVLEIERFVNFDTIFNPIQRKEIDDKLTSLKSLKLDPRLLHNPGILYLEGKSDKIGLEKISFPFIQEGKDGNLYGFIYRENPTEGIFYIYKLVNRIWEEFAKVQLWIT